MMNKRVIKKVRNFILEDHNLGFEEKLSMLRMIDDIRGDIDRGKDNLDTILLRLRYGVKQKVPHEWTDCIGIPSEEVMAAGLVEQPVSKGYVIRGGSYTRAKRTMQAMEKFEKKTGKRLVVL
jgi:hypothetical protein